MKRFTLMMMVMCFLMSIPLKMMAETVTFDEITVKSQYKTGSWGDNTNFNFTTTDGKIYTCVLKDVTAENVWFRIVKNKSDMQWGPNSSKEDLVLTSSYQQAYESKTHEKSFKIENAQGSTYTITWDNENNQIKCDKEGSGSGTTTEEWNTVNTNRLKDHVYTQGFYLAGNFFTFSDKDKVTYDDAVFKFQQQTDLSISEGARTKYDVYMVEIPASLTAHAQVMYVNESGEKVKIFGPTSACGISETYPTTEANTNWETLNGTNVFSEDKNYWDFSTRNKRSDEYSDGLYEVYIAVDKTSHEPVKWMIKHQAKKRVAFFISDAPDATAMPLYDAFVSDSQGGQFSNKFFATVNLAANRSYYVISNYIYNNTKVGDAGYGAFDPNLHAIPSQTTNKLFLQGNGDLDFTGNDPDNLIFPNGAPLKIDKNYWGTQIVEYNPSRGNRDKSVYGFCGDLILRTDRPVLTSVSLVGDAIPGTLNEDGSWNYKSNIADMVYDETEQCYKATVVTTVADDGQSKFRFVGNRTHEITWYENTNTDAKEMAKHPYNDPESTPGRTADANDPNKVNYTKTGDPTSEGYDSWNIIWNRPAGRWTVRLYFYTYSDGNNPVTEDYYTITASKDMVLHDVTDIVYGSETNKQIIQNKGNYKFLRTWSAYKTWKISNKVDVFVVNNVADNGSAVKLSLKNINKEDETGNYHVIPARTGVILATQSEASEIAGSQYIARQNYTSYNELVIPMEENKDEYIYDGKDNLLEPLYVSKVVPASDDKNFNYFFAYYNALIATNDEKNYGASDYLLGFWISKGSKPYPSNSSYLPIPKEKAAKMNRLGTSYDDFANVGNAKKVPGVIFDFANVDGTTGINEVVNQNSKLNDGKYYTLSGQQVEKPIAGGIYIHNGRKFVVK